MLVDEAKATMKAGDGGEGCVSFGKMRKSGPDGGNGGKGGDLYLEISSDLTLLTQFQSKPEIEAQDGVNGKKEKRAGANGEDLVVKIPMGSFLEDMDTGETFEFNKAGEKVLFLKGGEGGIGNFDLRSSSNTTPMETIPAKKGEERRLKITLRFLANYGLIGLPSAGKSSLLNELTKANVKTAAYHFTTLSPNLGVLPNGKILADIPGLIEGAHEGKGLGIKFLKHIQKVDTILHCISSDTKTPRKDYDTIRAELKSFDKKLLEKNEVIVLTKSDLADEKDIKKLKKEFEKIDREVIITSIHDLDSIEKLRDKLK